MTNYICIMIEDTENHIIFNQYASYILVYIFKAPLTAGAFKAKPPEGAINFGAIKHLIAHPKFRS